MHDLHHAKTIGNYASTFTWYPSLALRFVFFLILMRCVRDARWDNWMGTNIVVPDSYYTVSCCSGYRLRFVALSLVLPRRSKTSAR